MNSKPPRAGDYRGPQVEKRIPKRERYDLDIRSYAGQWKLLPEFSCRFLRDVVYCETPKEPNLECMNLFVPQAYIDENGTVDPDTVCGGFTASTAPILVHSAVMGYSEAPAAMLSTDRGGPDQKLMIQFLQAGMIVVSVAVRGRQTQDEQGNYIGKAPALVVDAKAALRFYRHNLAYLPGDTDRMIFWGVSAGGNLAALMGTTCDREEFIPYLREIGAVLDESDRVFAAQAFCPITDLSHADMAYEWMFQGQYRRSVPPFSQDPNGGVLTDFQRALSDELGKRYPGYVNSLSLREPETGEPLLLNEDGRSGSFYDALLRELEASATRYFRLLENGDPKAVSCTPEEYLSGQYTTVRRGPGGERTEPGTDKRAWLSWDGAQAHISSLDDMLTLSTKRMKSCPAFDNLELAEFENEEFGPADQKLSHFDPEIASVLSALRSAFPKECEKYAPGFEAIRESELIREQNSLLNPHTFIEPGAANLCEHFRIRVGSLDPHTSFSTAMLVACRLKQAGVDVDFAFTWDANHGVCDYEGEFLDWIHNILRRAL